MLISFDGLDSSGKATQSRLLCEHLQKKEIQVKKFCTPDYNTPSGKELKLRLQNKIGNWQETPWQEKMEFFAANRKEYRQEVLDALESGVVVIYDRYIPSSMAFISAEAFAAGASDTRQQVYDAVTALEYGKNAMPKEDISIFLDIPPRIAIDLLEGRKHLQGDEGEHTDYLHVQEALHQEYIRMVEEDPDHIIRIRCTEGGKLFRVEEIAEKVCEALAEKFPDVAHYFL